MHNDDLSMLKTTSRKSAKSVTKIREISENAHRPPIAPLKIRLKNTRVPTVTKDKNANKGKSLSTLLAEIVKDYKPISPPHRLYEDFKVEEEGLCSRSVENHANPVTSSLTKAGIYTFFFFVEGGGVEKIELQGDRLDRAMFNWSPCI